MSRKAVRKRPSAFSKLTSTDKHFAVPPQDRMINVHTAWADWSRTARPFANFRRENLQALTYKAEFDLDHQADYIDALVEAWAEKNPNWDVPVRAKLELQDLQLIDASLSHLDPSVANVRELREYIAKTRRLLEALAE